MEKLQPAAIDDPAAIFAAGKEQATTLATGVLALATGAEVLAGSVADKAVVPSTLLPAIRKGIATNTSASAGDVGEIIEDTRVAGSAVSLTSATAANIASITLTAGDWDVAIFAQFTSAASTVIGQLMTSLSSTSGTLDGTLPDRFIALNASFTPGSTNSSNHLPRTRVSLSATTTFYFVARANFTTSTLSAWGKLVARRAPTR